MILWTKSNAPRCSHLAAVTASWSVQPEPSSAAIYIRDSLRVTDQIIRFWGDLGKLTNLVREIMNPLGDCRVKLASDSS